MSLAAAVGPAALPAAAGRPLSAPPAPGRRTRRGPLARVDLQPAFVLHSYPWRETSLILDVFTRDCGRVALVARGAKRPTSQFRGLLAPFAPLSISWSGRSEIKSLIRAEWVGGLAPLRGDELLGAFYLNELLVRLLARDDPHEALFFCYAQALRALSLDDGRYAEVLRGFELDLLRQLGVAPTFDAADDGSAIEPTHWYRVDPERGVYAGAAAPPPADAAASHGAAVVGGAYRVRGASLLVLATRDLPGVMRADDAHGLLRWLIGYHLHGRPLNTHRILSELRKL